MKSLCAFLILLATSSFGTEPTMIGSKKFTESYVLGEIATRTLNEAGIPAQHRQGMGGTIIVWQALSGGQIDVYPAYTGTTTKKILKGANQQRTKKIGKSRGKLGVGITKPPVFTNPFALVMRQAKR